MAENIRRLIPAPPPGLFPALEPFLETVRVAFELRVLEVDNSDTTPDVGDYDLVVMSSGAGHSVSDFLGGIDGKAVHVIFTNANTTIVDGTNFQLSGGANFVGTADDTLTVVFYGGVWYELSRSVN